VTTFDDDLTPVVEEKETPESVDEVTTATLQRHRSSCDEEHMDVKMSSSDSDPDSHKYQGALAIFLTGFKPGFTTRVDGPS